MVLTSCVHSAISSNAKYTSAIHLHRGGGQSNFLCDSRIIDMCKSDDRYRCDVVLFGRPSD